MYLNDNAKTSYNLSIELWLNKYIESTCQVLDHTYIAYQNRLSGGIVWAVETNTY